MFILGALYGVWISNHQFVKTPFGDIVPASEVHHLGE